MTKEWHWTESHRSKSQTNARNKNQKNLILYGSSTKQLKIIVVETGSAAAHEVCLMSKYHKKNFCFLHKTTEHIQQSPHSSFSFQYTLMIVICLYSLIPIYCTMKTEKYILSIIWVSLGVLSFWRDKIAYHPGSPN